MARNFATARPLEADAPRLAEIHLAAMDSNPLLHAQFPTPDSLENLRRFLKAYTANQLRDAASGTLVARDTESNTIAGFVKWDSPSHPEDVKLESGDLRNLEGCQVEFLDGYASLAAQVRERSFGDRLCYRRCCLVTPIPAIRKKDMQFTLQPISRDMFSARAGGARVAEQFQRDQPILVRGLICQPSRLELCLHRPIISRSGRGLAPDAEGARYGCCGWTAGVFGEHRGCDPHV